MACLGHLHVSVVEGRNLVVRLDARPSVLLQIGKEQARTAPLKDSSCKWLSEFKLEVASEDACLVVTLLDDEHDIPVGSASLPIRTLITIGTTVRWVAIKDPDGREVGQVCLVLRFLKGTPQGLNGVKHENGFRSKAVTQNGDSNSDISSPSSSLTREENQNGANPAKAAESRKRQAKSSGPNKYLVAAGAAVTFLLAAFALRSHQKRRSKYYEVREGDTLYSIADSYGLSPDDVFEANMSVTSDPDKIFPGDRIYIP